MQTWKEKRKTIRHYNQQASIYDLQYLEEQNLKNENILNHANWFTIILVKINTTFTLDQSYESTHNWGCGTTWI